MRILFVSHEKNLYGASQSMLNIIDELSNEHEFIVLSKTYDGDFQDEVRKRGIKMIVSPYYVWERSKETKASWIKFKILWIVFGKMLNMFSALKVKREIKNDRIDLIHVNTSVISIGVELKSVLNAPLIWHIREFGKEDFNIYPLVSERKFFKELNKADGIVYISKAIQNKYESKLLRPRKKLIYNGVSENNINDKKTYHDKKNQTIGILVAGKITPGKGQNIAIEAAEILYGKGYRNFKMYIAGKGDLREIGVAQINIPQIVILGQVRDMKELRKKIDIELICSRSEAFGRVSIEAMMGQIPVIGSNTGGTPELISDGYNGFLYEYGNAKELSEKIELFFDNPKLLSELGHNAYVFAKDYFSIHRCAFEINNFYKEIAEENKNI